LFSFASGSSVYIFAIALIILSFEIPAVEKYIERKLKRDGKIGKIYYSISDKVGKYLK